MSQAKQMGIHNNINVDVGVRFIGHIIGGFIATALLITNDRIKRLIILGGNKWCKPSIMMQKLYYYDSISDGEIAIAVDTTNIFQHLIKRRQIFRSYDQISQCAQASYNFISNLLTPKCWLGPKPTMVFK